MVTSNMGKAIVIAEYDAGWPARFEAERDLVYATCGREAFTRIEHMGSTAVPGLAAKPIIDMMPGLRSLDDAPPIIERLATIGWEYVPEFEQPTEIDEGMPFRRYLRKDERGRRAFHMHMVEQGSDFWVKHLRFRDYLRAFPQERDAYADLKRGLAARFNARLTPSSNVNIGYTDQKTEFVERCLGKLEDRLTRSTPVALSPADRGWTETYARLRPDVVEAAGPDALDVQHVGSTSVPGLIAKPKVDIAVGAKDMEAADAIAARLTAAGYEPYDDAQRTDDWIAMYRVEHGRKIANVHIVVHGGERWRRFLAFRDYLRGHPEAAAAYAELKRARAEEFGRNRLGYAAAKSEFIAEICRLAE
jgi:GrpB-like predicted nucleotidyltransferase (UPF0157 family)